MTKTVKPAPSTGVVDLATLILSDNNPRFIKDKKFRQLVQSVKDFPQMLEKRRITIRSWDNREILAGNQRTRALRELGYTQIPVEWIQSADGWSEEQIKRFIVQDNLSAGEWDYDTLANTYELEDLTSWGLEANLYPEAEPLPGTKGTPGFMRRQAYIGDVFTATIGEGTDAIGYTIPAPTPLRGSEATPEANAVFNSLLKEMDKALKRFTKTAKKAGLPHSISKNGEDITELYRE